MGLYFSAILGFYAVHPFHVASGCDDSRSLRYNSSVSADPQFCIWPMTGWYGSNSLHFRHSHHYFEYPFKFKFVVTERRRVCSRSSRGVDLILLHQYC